MLFTKGANSKQKHETRFSSSGNYSNFKTESKSRFFFQVWLSSTLQRNFQTETFHDFLLSIMEAEDNYVEVPILLQKIANSAATT